MSEVRECYLCRDFTTRRFKVDVYADSWFVGYLYVCAVCYRKHVHDHETVKVTMRGNKTADKALGK